MSYPEMHKIDGDLVIHLRDGVKKPIWQYRFKLPNGKYKRSSTGTTDKKKAIQIAVEARKDVEQRYLQERPLDVGIFDNMLFFLREDVETWPDSDKKQTYLRTIDKHLKDNKYLKGRRMDSFNGQYMEKVKRSFKRIHNEKDTNSASKGKTTTDQHKPLKASSKNGILTVLRAVFEEAVARGHIMPGDIPYIKNDALDDQVIRNEFSEEEIKWIRLHLQAEFDEAIESFDKRMARLGNPRVMEGYERGEVENPLWLTDQDDRVMSKYYHRLFFEILIGTGMRPKSLIALKFSDFVFDSNAKRWSINNVTSRKGKKSTKIVRTVIPTLYCEEHLREMRRIQELLNIPKSRRVFTKELSSMSEQFERFIVRHNLKYKDGYVKTDDKELNKEYSRSLYSLRHSYITQRIERGVSIAKIAYNCNTSSEMIEKHYNHYTSKLSDEGFE